MKKLKCNHPIRAMGPAVKNQNGNYVRGCDSIGTYTLHICLACREHVWDCDFSRIKDNAAQSEDKSHE